MKMEPIKNKILAAPLAVSLVFASAATANAQAEFNARINIDARGNTLTVPVDCDALDSNGNLTIEFLRPFDVFGHLEHENDINDVVRHLNLHGVKPEDVQKSQAICHQHFPDNF